MSTYAQKILKQHLCHTLEWLKEDVNFNRKITIGRYGFRNKHRAKNSPCFYCGKPTSTGTIDHYIPLSKEGTNALDNIRYACIECNQKKKNLLPEEFEKLFGLKLPKKKHQVPNFLILLRRPKKKDPALLGLLRAIRLLRPDDYIQFSQKGKMTYAKIVGPSRSHWPRFSINLSKKSKRKMFCNVEKEYAG